MILGLTAATAAHAQGFLDKLKQSVGGTYTVRGRVQVQDGQWLTCFEGIKTGYLGAADLARPGDAKVDPATGRVTASTAAIPAVIMTRTGVVTSNDCDSLAEQKLLVAPTTATATPGTAAGGDTGHSDPYGCTRPEWTKDEIVRRRREIMDCQAEAITEKAAARQQAKAAAAGAGSAAAAAPSPAQAQAANARLQQETAEKFKAIQAQAATPTTAPAQSDEDLAWDGAKLCGLKPAYMMKLKEEAVGFVRIDKQTDKIILTEVAGGARREIALDGTAYAQRMSFNAQAIGQGGDTCGRAFWNAEAYKAAGVAMSR
jgi:hypothetical protein